MVLKSVFPELKEVIAITFYKELIEESLVFQTAIFQVLFVESLILAAMAQFVCILISTLRMEREMGIMRSIGLQKRSIFGIYMSESPALGISAIIIGLIDGLFGSILLSWYISLSIPVGIQLPLDRVILWVIFSFMVTLASTIIPSYRSSQKNIIATISGRPMTKMYIQKPKPFLFLYPPPVPPHLKREYSSQIGTEPKDLSIQTSVWSFLKDEKVKILITFLILFAILTLNYILDANMIVRGLIPSDIIWRQFLVVFLYFGYEDTFFLINLLLFFVGLAAIGPISYYFSNDVPPGKLIKSIIRSLVLGVICILICYILITILTFLILFSISLIVAGTNSAFYLGAILILVLVFIIIIFLIGSLIFQRIWVFLILQGSNPDLNLKDKIRWTRKTAPKGQLGFILLLFLHISLQALLFLITSPPEVIFPLSPRRVSADPILFLVLTGYEVGFYLLLIIYQLVQFRKQRNLFSEVEL